MIPNCVNLRFSAVADDPLYGLLGITSESSFDEVRHAFRVARGACHPDHNAGDPSAAQRFTAINAAWELVNTREKWEAHRADAARVGRTSLGLSKVVVHGYSDWFPDAYPKVHVFWNGVRVGSVQRGGSVAFDIDHDGEVSFSAFSSFPAAVLRVKAGKVTQIKVAWNRQTGTPVPRLLD